MIAGSIPIGVVGILSREIVAGPLRNLWVVVAALIGWSVVIFVAERVATQQRGESTVRFKDAMIIGFIQCVALIPGVSRSGAAISAGLFRGLDRVTATRLSFFLAIPALVAAGAYEGISEAAAVADGVGWAPTLVATAISFGVAYLSGMLITEDLAEWNYGAYEGLTTAQIVQLRGRSWDLWADGAPRRAHVLRAVASCWLGVSIRLGGSLTLGTGSLSELGFEHHRPAILRRNCIPEPVDHSERRS